MMNDLISRQEAIDAICEEGVRLERNGMVAMCEIKQWCIDLLDRLPSAQPEQAIKDCRNCKHGRYNGHWDTYFCYCPNDCNDWNKWEPSAQPEQRYTKEELMVFRHGISLSLLSKRSAQHWRYDEDTATEIEFLERLYEKVGADIRGEEE